MGILRVKWDSNGIFMVIFTLILNLFFVLSVWPRDALGNDNQGQEKTGRGPRQAMTSLGKGGV